MMKISNKLMYQYESNYVACIQYAYDGRFEELLVTRLSAQSKQFNNDTISSIVVLTVKAACCMTVFISVKNLFIFY